MVTDIIFSVLVPEFQILSILIRLGRNECEKFQVDIEAMEDIKWTILLFALLLMYYISVTFYQSFNEMIDQSEATTTYEPDDLRTRRVVKGETDDGCNAGAYDWRRDALMEMLRGRGEAGKERREERE
ncbi:hypothetical protein EJ110_NYTH13746 [Nymphaea thermarum]|nr:hypothetical protein EJ110_NYTH13746 [Nymphaea thermarum]